MKPELPEYAKDMILQMTPMEAKEFCDTWLDLDLIFRFGGRDINPEELELLGYMYELINGVE